MRTFYHLSFPCNRDSITNHGLKTKTRSGKDRPIRYNKKLFLFSDLNDMPWTVVYGIERDLWEVKIPDGVKVEQDMVAYEDGHRSSWMTGYSVPPENVKFLKCLPNPYEYPFREVDGHGWGLPTL